MCVPPRPTYFLYFYFSNVLWNPVLGVWFCQKWGMLRKLFLFTGGQQNVVSGGIGEAVFSLAGELLLLLF